MTCGRDEPEGQIVTEPKLVAEVMSPSTRDFDTIGKIVEYKAVESIDHILFIEPNAPEVVVYSRGEDRAWAQWTVRDIEQRIDLPSLDITLTLAELYEGVEFPTNVRLTLG